MQESGMPRVQKLNEGLTMRDCAGPMPMGNEEDAGGLVRRHSSSAQDCNRSLRSYVGVDSV
jgi:hypothetical protein